MAVVFSVFLFCDNGLHVCQTCAKIRKWQLLSCRLLPDSLHCLCSANAVFVQCWCNGVAVFVQYACRALASDLPCFCSEEIRMATKQDRVTVRFDGETMGQLEGLAEAKNMPIAGVVRAACDLYIKDQKLGAELDSMETRLAASFIKTQAEIDRLGKKVARAVYRSGDDVQLLIALFDQMAKFHFSTTPEVIDRQAAAALGNQRHAAFIADLHKAYSSRKRKSLIATQMDELAEDEPGGEAAAPADPGLDWEDADDQDQAQGSDGADRQPLAAVAFADRERARAAGACWDKEAKTWYAPAGIDLGPLQEWLPPD